MKKLKYAVFCVARFFVKLCYPKMKAEGTDHIPKEPCIIVGNHAQANGPIISELYVPGKNYTWCAGEMLNAKEIPAYAYKDFWSHKPKGVRWFYKLLSFLIVPLAVCIFQSAHTIAVYRDKRLISTFRDTVKRLDEGANVIIFPENGEPYNDIVTQFQERFVDVARVCKKNGPISFVPMYVAPKLKKIVFAKPIVFRPSAPIEEERVRICEYLKQEITQTAVSLARHKVVPYRNVPKRLYPYNKEDERANEQPKKSKSKQNSPKKNEPKE